LGLTPFNSNIMGNISVTAALAVLTMIITNVNGSKDYWGHIFWFPGVPTPVRLIILPVELIGIFTKPFALTVRLFANISGGHFMILSLVSLMFILNDMGRNPAGGWAIMPLSVAFTFGIMILEVLVAVIQAYVFTLLTCVFLGAAMESHDHHDDHSHDHAHAHAHAQ
jgi:F-type H+-transporting ATPase subunit a